MRCVSEWASEKERNSRRNLEWEAGGYGRTVVAFAKLFAAVSFGAFNWIKWLNWCQLKINYKRFKTYRKTQLRISRYTRCRSRNRELRFLPLLLTSQNCYLEYILCAYYARTMYIYHRHEQNDSRVWMDGFSPNSLIFSYMVDKDYSNIYYTIRYTWMPITWMPHINFNFFMVSNVTTMQ